ncbi:MAG TPA: hypothetical protein VFX76_07670, partial [Roseiflexaceae bacterium]|nr:hypothetical protein [Roseiflexaceae bacterium]
WERGLKAAEQLDMPYEMGRLCYELGRSLPPGDPVRDSYLQRAAELFARLEASDDLRMVETALAAHSGTLHM